ncbi:MAG TPA: NAD-dependent epimerase/dehydratase family protein [Pyrinomonadaceae bacterium]|jgi:dTDP-L-rhamnose 4-epimerase
MNILITGGAGFIGTHLRKKLTAENHSVRILDNLLPQVHGENPALDFSGCEFIEGDVRDAETAAKAVAGMDVVYHLAAETGVGQSQYEIERYVSTNTHGTAVVLQAANSASVRQVIISSSRAVYGEGVHICGGCAKNFVPDSRKQEDLDAGRWEVYCPDCGQEAAAQPMRENDPSKPISVYGLTKLQQEQLAEQVRRAYRLPITNLRFFNVYGPGQSLTNPYVGVLGTFFRQISAGRGIDVYEDGQMRRDFVYIDDIVEALRLSLANEKTFDRTINVGNGESVTLQQAGEEVFRALGVEPRMNFSGKYRLGDIHHAVGDTRYIESVLGYLPPTKFADGLREFVRWAQTKNYADAANIDSIAEKQLAERNLLRRAGR